MSALGVDLLHDQVNEVPAASIGIALMTSRTHFWIRNWTQEDVGSQSLLCLINEAEKGRHIQEETVRSQGPTKFWPFYALLVFL